MLKMQKYNPRIRTLSSSSKEKQSVITPQKSLSKLKERLKSSYVHFEQINHKDRVKDEYMVKRNVNNVVKDGNKKQLKTIDHKRRSKESLEMINRDIRFENQLRDEIKQLNQTLFECQNLEKELIQQRIPQNNGLKSNLSTQKINIKSSIQQNIFYTNLKELANLQQTIKNREKQISQVTDEIADLKQQHWNIHIKKIPLKEKQISTNFSLDRFILADQMSQLNEILKMTIQQYRKKYNDLKAMKATVNNAYKDSEYFYQIRAKNAEKSKFLLIEKPITYVQFKQNLLKKRKQTQIQKNHIQRAKSIESIIAPGVNQFSNISNVSAIMSSNFIDQWLNRELLPGQIPQLPKQHNPTIKSMNLKKKVLKQAIETQKKKHQKESTQLIDKLLFLHDEDTFLTEQIQSHLQEINSIESKFSWIEMKSKHPTVISKIPCLKSKKKLSEEEGQIQFVGKKCNKNYIDENLLLDNTGNNSSLLDQTGKLA